LDLIGDLALLGRPLLGRVVAHKAGHALHTQLVARLLADRSLWTQLTLTIPQQESVSDGLSAIPA
jgi:UDP-3-O-[3-hydroxymyristoyl] N-acetylglucosamine deacetylase